MRANVIVTLIGCFCQLIQSQGVNEAECIGKEDGTPVEYIGDPCMSCICESGYPRCMSEACPMEVKCHPELLIFEKGQCCPRCQDGCYDDEYGFEFIEAGSEKSDRSGCLICMCSIDSQLDCVMASCMQCLGRHVNDGTCCGRCEEHQCKVGDNVYEDGDPVPSPDPCDTCFCRVSGDNVDVECHRMFCDECPGVWTDDGSCCGQCEIMPDTCYYKGVEYGPGEDIPTGDPCEFCTCYYNGKFAEKQCAMMACAMCFGKFVPDGTCCGSCLPFDECEYEGNMYPVGIELPQRDLCEFCSCMRNGNGVPEVVCAMMACAPCLPGFEHVHDGKSCCGECIPKKPDCSDVLCIALACPEEMQYKPEGQCCPECKCRHNRRTYNPGPVGRKCAGCVCRKGEVTCIPPVCPEKNLECVDAVQGEDCCFHCPNGKTCFYGRGRDRVTLRYGEYRFINGRIVTCSGDPWFPVAFSVGGQVPRHVNRAMRRYQTQIANYMNTP